MLDAVGVASQGEGLLVSVLLVAWGTSIGASGATGVF